jgi:hypothetical protein
MNDLELEIEKKYAKAARLKTVKHLEKEYSKELISVFRQREVEKQKEEEFKMIV